MNVELVDTFVRWLSGLLAYATLAILFYGIWRGTRRQVPAFFPKLRRE